MTNWKELAQSGKLRNLILLAILLVVASGRLLTIWHHPDEADVFHVDVSEHQEYQEAVSRSLLRDAAFDRCQKAERAQGRTFEQAQLMCEAEYPPVAAPEEVRHD